MGRKKVYTEAEAEARNKKSKTKYRLGNKEYRDRYSKVGVMNEIKERLGNRCFICGDGRKVNLHHKNRRKNDWDYSINRLQDYFLLCPNHHTYLHYDKLTEDEKKELKKYEVTIMF